MNKAVIVTENSYPEGDAGAVRQHALAKLLLDMNYDVLVIGYGSPTKGNINVYDGVIYLLEKIVLIKSNAYVID